MDIPRAWGVRADEVEMTYPCDELVHNAADVWFRAVTVHAPTSIVYRWLCQLKVAPYSYDLLDNFGRRSPAKLTPGVDELSVGDRVMMIFRLTSFAHDDHLTVEMHAPVAIRIFGQLALSYMVRENASDGVRLIAKLRVTDPPGGLGRLRRRALAWGDLFMMKQQLNTLKRLAENSARMGTDCP